MTNDDKGATASNDSRFVRRSAAKEGLTIDDSRLKARLLLRQHFAKDDGLVVLLIFGAIQQRHRAVLLFKRPKFL